MADSYVCSGATMKCTMGTSQAKLTVLPTRTVFLTGKPQANISDHLSMVNLAPFGNCRSMAFPATASATAAAQGTLTPMPCMHNTPFPWMMGKNDYIVKGDPALLKSSTCQCMWGGTISITDDGQGTGSPDMSRKPKEKFSKDQPIKNADSNIISRISKEKRKYGDHNDKGTNKLEQHNNLKFEIDKVGIGEKGHGKDHDSLPEIQQKYSDTCGIRSQQIVLRDFGIDLSEDLLVEWSKRNGLYDNNGTSPEDVGKILEAAGISVTRKTGANIFDLMNELVLGHRVIVGVDANELWYNDHWTDKLKNWFDDVFKEQGGNHALIVAGVNVNTKNPKEVNVILTDPGSGDLRIEYPLEQFMDAWQDTNTYMVSTNIAAPYQYDPVTHAVIPSGFSSDYSKDSKGNNIYNITLSPSAYTPLTDKNGNEYYYCSPSVSGKPYLYEIPINGGSVSYEQYKKAIDEATDPETGVTEKKKFFEALANSTKTGDNTDKSIIDTPKFEYNANNPFSPPPKVDVDESLVEKQFDNLPENKNRPGENFDINA